MQSRCVGPWNGSKATLPIASSPFDLALDEELTITHRTPQGSILGPMSFGWYMKNLPYTVKSCSIESYVDDTKIHLSFSSKDTDSCLTKITEDFRHTAGWCCSDQILINPSKTKLILFGTKPLLSRAKEVIPFLGQFLIPVTLSQRLGHYTTLKPLFHWPCQWSDLVTSTCCARLIGSGTYLLNPYF